MRRTVRRRRRGWFMTLTFRERVRPVHGQVPFRARTFSGAMDDAADLVQKLREADGGRDEFRVLGPAPAPLGRLRGEYRAQLLVKGSNRPRIRAALQAALVTRPDLQRRIVVDVDPLNVL